MPSCVPHVLSLVLGGGGGLSLWAWSCGGEGNCRARSGGRQGPGRGYAFWVGSKAGSLILDWRACPTSAVFRLRRAKDDKLGEIIDFKFPS